MSDSSRRPALVFIFIVLFLDVLGVGLIIPVLPTLVGQFSEGGEASVASIYGWLAASYSLMQFVFAPLLGSLSDRYGRRPVILFSLFGAGVDYFLMAFASSLPVFFIARIVAGLAGANFSAATAYIADISSPEKRGANFGLIGAAFGLGFVIGPMVGGVLGDIDVRMPFYVAGTITLLNWLYGYFIVPESLDPKNRREFSWKRSNPFGALANLRRYPTVVGLAGAFVLTGIAHQVYPATWVLYTENRFGWSTRDVGFSLGLVGVMAALVQGGLGRVVIPKFGEKRIAVLGLLVGCLAFVFYGFSTVGWLMYVIIPIGAIGGLATPAVQGMISNAVGDDEQGEVQGALTGLQSIASFVGLLALSQLYAFFISDAAPARVPGAAFFAAALLDVLAIVLAVRSLRGRS